MMDKAEMDKEAIREALSRAAYHKAAMWDAMHDLVTRLCQALWRKHRSPKMTVFGLFEYMDYEGSTLVGLYTTKERAEVERSRYEDADYSHYGVQEILLEGEETHGAVQTTPEPQRRY